MTEVEFYYWLKGVLSVSVPRTNNRWLIARIEEEIKKVEENKNE